jgi:hypothetical protein
MPNVAASLAVSLVVSLRGGHRGFLPVLEPLDCQAFSYLLPCSYRAVLPAFVGAITANAGIKEHKLGKFKPWLPKTPTLVNYIALAPSSSIRTLGSLDVFVLELPK